MSLLITPQLINLSQIRGGSIAVDGNSDVTPDPTGSLGSDLNWSLSSTNALTVNCTEDGRDGIALVWNPLLPAGVIPYINLQAGTNTGALLSVNNAYLFMICNEDKLAISSVAGQTFTNFSIVIQLSGPVSTSMVSALIVPPSPDNPPPV